MMLHYETMLWNQGINFALVLDPTIKLFQIRLKVPHPLPLKPWRHLRTNPFYKSGFVSEMLWR